jgi:hypothetical protein
MPFKSEKQRGWMHENYPEIAKRWEKEYKKGGKTCGPLHEGGGKMYGPSHKKGGIPIEVEGGEIIINKTENDAAGKHEKDLLKLNKEPDMFEIVRTTDSRGRKTKIQ